MNLRTLHRASALLITAFACLHLVNHLVSLAGVPSHVAFMELAQLQPVEVPPAYKATYGG